VKDFIGAGFREVPFTPWPAFGQLLCTPTFPHAPMCLISWRGCVTILYTILTGRVMDVGQYIANEIHRCVNASSKATLGNPSFITHLCSLAGVHISVPSLEKATQDLDFSYFQRFCSVAPRLRRRHQPQAKPEPEPEPEATPTIDMQLQALEAKLNHLQLLEPQMQALYRLEMPLSMSALAIPWVLEQLSRTSENMKSLGPALLSPMGVQKCPPLPGCKDG